MFPDAGEGMGIDCKGATKKLLGDENVLYLIMVVVMHIYTFVELIKLYT